MKISKQQLKRIIKEEVAKALNERLTIEEDECIDGPCAAKCNESIYTPQCKSCYEACAEAKNESITLGEQSTDEGCFEDSDCSDGYKCKDSGLCCNDAGECE